MSSEFHMWFVLLLTIGSIYAFVSERWSIELTSVTLLSVLLIFGQFFPLYNASGHNLLDATNLLGGFANPSLIAVLALLVMGQGIIQTDVLRPLLQLFKTDKKLFAWIAVISILIFVAVVSAFMNNTPLVIIAIPVLQALAASSGQAISRIMLPLSYAAILGGMTTLIGSSTNLLVSSTMQELGYEPLSFFAFVVPGIMMASVGLIYVLFVLPYFLKSKTETMRSQLAGGDKEFVAELDIMSESEMIGMTLEDGRLTKFSELNIRLIQRKGHLVLPPFEDHVIEEGDILIVAATRETLTAFLTKYPGFMLSEDDSVQVTDGDEEEEKNITRNLAEIMVPPGSRYVDMTLDRMDIPRQFGSLVLGIQRRARVVRRRLGRIRLEPGDVLLVAGPPESIDKMRDHQELILLSGTRKDMPVPKKAPVAGLIFLGTIALAATNVISIPVAAFTGAVLMIATGCINIRQATRALDRKIFLLVGSMLALGTALQYTDGADFLAGVILSVPFADQPLILAGLLFALVAVATNVLTNNACAILFTPIALNMAANTGVDPYIFAVTVVFAANCSFASPIGYQTNLLVMGPGGYGFSDFVKAGVPLMIILLITYLFVAHFYFGL